MDNFDWSKGVRGEHAGGTGHYVARFFGGPKDGQMRHLTHYTQTMYFDLARYECVKIGPRNAQGIVELEFQYSPIRDDIL